MSEVAIYAGASLEQRMKYAQTLAAAGDLIPKGLWAPSVRPDGSPGPLQPSPGKILAVMETGSMLGLHPMAALQSIDIVEGKTTLSARLMSGLIRSKGHEVEIEWTGSLQGGDIKVSVTGTRADTGESYTASWTMADSLRARLIQSYEPGENGYWEVRSRSERGGIKPWEAYTEDMMWSRAVSRLGRHLFSDVLFGMYTPEEIMEVVGEDSEEAEEAEIEPVFTEDWETLILRAETQEELQQISERIKRKGEGTEKLRALYAARLGSLERDESESVDSEEEVSDDGDHEAVAAPTAE